MLDVNKRLERKRVRKAIATLKRGADDERLSEILKWQRLQTSYAIASRDLRFFGGNTITAHAARMVLVRRDFEKRLAERKAVHEANSAQLSLTMDHFSVD